MLPIFNMFGISKAVNPKIILVFTILLFMLNSCSVPQIRKVDFLLGTWKVKDQEQYEFWEKNGEKEMTGYSYRINQGEKKISETLRIRPVKGHLVYEATVPTQNNGTTIPFTYNSAISSLHSFENLQHDFPKKIQYRPLSENEIEVVVEGENGKGFSYVQQRQ